MVGKGSRHIEIFGRTVLSGIRLMVSKGKEGLPLKWQNSEQKWAIKGETMCL